MMRAYVAIDPADVCYPFEAAAWVAFGKIPEANFDEHGVETRGRVDPIAEGFSPEGDDLFTADQLAIFFDREEEAARYIKAKYHDPAVSSVEEYFTDYSTEFRKWGYFYGPREESGYIEALFVETAEARIHFARERARLKVLLALMEGKVKARGIRISDEWRGVDPSQWTEAFWDELNDLEPEEIPPSEWENSEIIWSEDPSAVIMRSYLYPTLSVSDVLRHFEHPDVEERAVEAVRIGATVIIGFGGEGLATVKSSRGRQPKGAGMIKTAVTNEFLRRSQDGCLADKNEAVCQEAIEWVLATFGETISRTTAQRYLAPMFAARKERP